MYPFGTRCSSKTLQFLFFHLSSRTPGAPGLFALDMASRPECCWAGAASALGDLFSTELYFPAQTLDGQRMTHGKCLERCCGRDPSPTKLPVRFHRQAGQLSQVGWGWPFPQLACQREAGICFASRERAMASPNTMWVKTARQSHFIFKQQRHL